jgi:nucleotide-binding universal stress UspA family protein
MFKKIAVALDGSPCSQQALEVAIGLAKAEGAQLSVCSVVDPIVVAGTAPPSPAMDIVMSDLESAAHRVVAAAVREGQLHGLSADGEARRGVPAFEILDFLRRSGADAVVMGTHGRSGLRHLLMGSVAEAVLRESAIPVIVVRERDYSPVG